MLRFRLFGIPVRVQPFFLILAVLLGMNMTNDADDVVLRMVAWVAIVFTGVLAHELGHALVSRMFGMTPRIELHGFGGLTSWESRVPPGPGRMIIISAAGPAIGVIVGLAAWLASILAPPLEGSFAAHVYVSLIWVNLGWGVLNLIPMLPLDGGNIMASTFELLFGASGVRAARWISLLLAAGMLAAAVAYQQLFMAVVVLMLGFTNWRALQVETRLGPDRALLYKLAEAERLFRRGELAQALSLAEEVLGAAQGELVRGEAAAMLAVIRLKAGDVDGARAAVEAAPRGRPVDAGIRGALLLESGRPEDALDVFAESLPDERPGGAEEAFVQAVIDLAAFDRGAEILSGDKGRLMQVGNLERFVEVAYRAGAFEAAARVGLILWDLDGRPSRAYNVACALARAGLLDEAMGWLGQARDAGFSKLHLLDEDEDLAPLRAREGWAELRSEFTA